MNDDRAVSTRDRILCAAGALFFREGYRAVGVDAISAAAGMGKMTLYRHFGTKDDLIEAYLLDANAGFWVWFDRATGSSGDAREQLRNVFVALADLVVSPACYGCPFISVVGEYSDRDYPGHRVAVQHKLAVLSRFRDMAAAAGARDPHALAEHLLLLMDGAFASARMSAAPRSAIHLVSAADAVIGAQFD